MGHIIRCQGLALQLTEFGYVVSGALKADSVPNLWNAVTTPSAIVGDGEFDAMEVGPTSRLLKMVSEEDMVWEQLHHEQRLVEFQEKPLLFNGDHRQPCWDCRSKVPAEYMADKTVRIRPTVRIQVTEKLSVRERFSTQAETINLISKAAVAFYKLKKIPFKVELKLFNGEKMPYTDYVALTVSTGNQVVDNFWGAKIIKDFHITLYAIVTKSIIQARRSYNTYYDDLIERFQPRYKCARLAIADSPSQRLVQLNSINNKL